MFSPLTYDWPVFRPPSEAGSLIFQVSLGCSWNRCTFCEMYKGKQYRARPVGEVLDEVVRAAAAWPDTRHVFLADGDPLSLPTDTLVVTAREIRRHFPRLARLSAYASPRNLRDQGAEGLGRLRQAGISLVYTGIESGDDEVLLKAGKGETAASTVDALLLARQAGMAVSVMLVGGLGGKPLSAAHAAGSADVVNRVQPEYLSWLVLGFEADGERRFRASFGSAFEPLGSVGILREMASFLSATELRRTIFRSDHASNLLPLRGTLGRDRDSLLAVIDRAVGLCRSWA